MHELPTLRRFRLVGPTPERIWSEEFEADTPTTLGAQCMMIVGMGPKFTTWYLQVWSEEHRCWCDQVVGNIAHPMTVKWPGWGDYYVWKAKWTDLDLGLQKAHLAVHDEQLPPHPKGIPRAWIRGG